MLWTLLEVGSVALTTCGVLLTTSTSNQNRARGFMVLMLAGLCSIAVFYHEALFIMLAQSIGFMLINVLGFKNKT